MFAKPCLTIWAALCLAASVASAQGLGLGPQDLLVVANASAEGSGALAKYYCVARGVDESRLLLIHTSGGAVISRKEYDENIKAPIRDYLLKNKLEDKVKCIALVWGVPVRVLGSELGPKERELVNAYSSAGARLHLRLAADVKLLASVGESFPAPRTDSLAPLGQLFDAKSSAADVDKPDDADKLKADFDKNIRLKEAAAGRLDDPAKRRIALRQLAALRLDVYGIKGLAESPAPAAPAPAASAAPAVTTATAPAEGAPPRAELDKEIVTVGAELEALVKAEETVESARKAVDLAQRLAGVWGARDHCQKRLDALDTAFEDAAVDSELALVLEKDTPTLRMMRPNPMYWRLPTMTSRPADVPASIIMACRIDGPTPKDALRIIKDSIATEKDGLKGTFYIDAGGKYPYYDEHLRKLHEMLTKGAKLKVVMDEKETLFAPGACPDAALYVGWYSLRKYVPAFKWNPGAVGWHIASFEAENLRTPESTEWCVKMIQNGVAATLGAVNEPFLGTFPLPQDFFALLLTGHFSLAECYWKTVPVCSWRLTLIGDPLYNPFKLHPQMSIYALPPEMVGRDRTGTEKP